MYERLTLHELERDGVPVAAWSGGRGDPVLLLHGYPQTSYMWRRVVPELVERHHVIVMDLRGYGRSGAPAPDALDRTYSKREMAADVVHLLDSLDLGAVHLVGHDRGGRVVHRFCLDHPERVATAAVLDIVPTLHMFDNVDRAMAEAYFHWFFLTRPDGLPEALLRADAETWIRSRLVGRHGPAFAFDERAMSEYTGAFSRPGVIEATCSDYRAAGGVDLEHDRKDQIAGRLISHPLLVGWGTRSYVGEAFDVPAVWSQFAADVRPAAIDADHYVAEENPSATLAALTQFWKSR